MLVEVEISSIERSVRAREDYGNIEDLAESIKEKGLIQPITIAATEDGKYKLLAGGRRLKACESLGHEKILCVKRLTEGGIDEMEIELIENVQRKDFTWAEKCRLEEKIYETRKANDPNWSQRKTSKLLDKARSAVSQDIELAKAIKAVPALAEATTQKEAWTKWNRMKEDLAVQAIVKKQEKEAEDAPKDKPTPPSHRIKFSSFKDYIDTKYIIDDVFEGVNKLSKEVINFCEIDPPYAVDLAAHRQKAQDQHIVSTYNEIPEASYPEFLNNLAISIYRVMKPHSWGIFWYGSKWYPEVRDALTIAGFKVSLTPAIWVKTGGGYTPNPKIQLSNLYENFLVFRKGVPTLAKEGRGNVFNYAQPPSSLRIHPTQRPVDLMEDILQTFTNESCIILSPFLGSGVTLRAAYRLQRTAFGYDKDPTYKNRLIAKESLYETSDNNL